MIELVVVDILLRVEMDIVLEREGKKADMRVLVAVELDNFRSNLETQEEVEPKK